MKHLKFLLVSTALYVLSCCNTLAQERSNAPSATPIGSLSLDSGTAWLQHVFDARIPDSIQIVGLGEVSHGGFEPIAFKAKMIQYLVEKRGYRNILFELSDFGTIMAIRDALNSSLPGDPDPGAIGVGKLNAIQAFDKVLRALFHWLKQYNLKHPTDKVQIGGFDLIFGNWICNYILYKYIIPFDPPGAKTISFQLSNADASDSSRAKIISEWFRTHAALLKARLDKKEFKWLEFNVRNAEYKFLLPLDEGSGDQWNNYRDSIMAKNVTALAGSSKTILWAHNGHISPWNIHLMGVHLEQYYRGHYYTVATDFSQIATVDILDKQKSAADSGYILQRNFASGTTTAANTLFRRYGISDGIVFQPDIIKYWVPLEINLIDANGFHMTTASERAFDALVFFDEIHPDAVITHKSQL